MLQNQIAFCVTGAGRGIGRAIALQLAGIPALVGTATTEGGAQKITGYLKEAGLKGIGIT